jgi:hypothetical protein
MDIKDQNDGKLIVLSKAFDSRGKALYFFYFLLFFIPAGFFLRMLLTEDHLPVGGIIVIVLAVAAFYIAAYRFVNKAVMSEKIFVNKQELQLINQGLFRSITRTYQVPDISNFRHLKKPELTDHPLAGKTFDFLGFQTEQKVISEMHGDNRLSFDWKGATVLFGQEIYSWEFEALGILLYDITGNDLRYIDEFEKTIGFKD